MVNKSGLQISFPEKKGLFCKLMKRRFGLWVYFVKNLSYFLKLPKVDYDFSRIQGGLEKEPREPSDCRLT
jgi:hypothetical protein